MHPSSARRTDRPVGRAAAPCASVEPLEARQLLTTLPTGFSETQVATGFLSPTSMTLAPDGRIFVAEQAGQLRVIKNNQLLPDPFLTVSTQVVNERGFGGVVLDPNFETNGYVYVYYTASTPDIHNRVSRFTADPANPDHVLPGSETVLIDIDNAASASYHQGGAMHFGTDGKLYVAVGEHGGTTRAQSLDWLFGKMLRINPDGTIPTDNPFYNQATGDRKAIWAMGLRNPFTFAIQPGTGLMYINDVGQNLWEEIDQGTPGGNYGWPEAEGPSTDPRFITPILAIPHPDARAITGGDFYNPASPQFPASYVGAYFFGDLDHRVIRKFDTTTHQASDFISTTLGYPVDIDTAADGSLYYLARPIDNPRPGGVYRVTYSANGAPAIDAQPQSRTVAQGAPVTFSVTASGAAPLGYQWQRNGSNIAGATSSSYTLASPTTADSGAQFRAVVSNGAGSVTSNAATLTVTNGSAPTATITTPASGSTFAMGDTIAFVGTGTDPDDGPLPASAFTWRADYITGGVIRPLLAPTSGSRSGSFTLPTLTPYTRTDVAVRVTLTVTDSTGLTSTSSVDLAPRLSNVSLSTNVPGLQLAVDGQPTPAPASFAGVVGFERLLGAPATQTVNGVTYNFVSWSDGGAAEHTVNMPAVDTTYAATYQAVDDGSTNPPDSPDLTVAFLKSRPASLTPGTPARVKVRLNNAGGTRLAGATDVAVYLSSDEFLQDTDPLVGTVSKNVRLRAGKGKTLNVPIKLPDGTAALPYHLLAWADSGKAVAESNETNNVADATVDVAAAGRDLSLTFSDVRVAGGKKLGTATLLVREEGDVPLDGPLTVRLAASTDTTPDAADAVLATLTRRLRLKPGSTKLVRVRFDPGGLAPGTYYATATVDPDGAIAETDETNNGAVSGGTFVVE